MGTRCEENLYLLHQCFKRRAATQHSNPRPICPGDRSSTIVDGIVTMNIVTPPVSRVTSHLPPFSRPAAMSMSAHPEEQIIPAENQVQHNQVQHPGHPHPPHPPHPQHVQPPPQPPTDTPTRKRACKIAILVCCRFNKIAAKAPSVRRACTACHAGKTRCSESLPCQANPALILRL